MAGVLALRPHHPAAPSSTPSLATPSTHRCAGGGRPPPATLPNSKGVIRFPPVWWGWVGFSIPLVCLKELDFHSREREACREHSLRENERRPLTPATISPRPPSTFSVCREGGWGEATAVT